MPNNFQNKNGATLSGHSDKWQDKNRRSNSTAAGQGSKGSRNQGTGIQGKLNAEPSQGVDTSKMSPAEKLKYFNALGLMPAPEPEQPKAVNPVKELTTKLATIFKDTPALLMDIVKDLRATPQDQLKQKSLAILNAMKDNNSTNPHDVSGLIMSVLKDEPQDTPEPKRSPIGDMHYRRMTPEQFVNDNGDLPKANLLSLVKQAQQFDDVGGALYYINMARDNVEDHDDAKSIISSMHATADSLSDLGFDLK